MYNQVVEIFHKNEPNTSFMTGSISDSFNYCSSSSNKKSLRELHDSFISIVSRIKQLIVLVFQGKKLRLLSWTGITFMLTRAEFVQNIQRIP